MKKQHIDEILTSDRIQFNEDMPSNTSWHGNTKLSLESNSENSFYEKSRNTLVQNKQQKGDKSTKLLIRCLDDIQEKSIEWLWKNWLPLGQLTMLAGAGGCGKTNLMMSLAAAITIGGKFPDGTDCEKSGKVVIYSTEDCAADTLKPRLMSYNADSSKVQIIDGVRINGSAHQFSIDNIDLLNGYARNNPDLRLLIIDPIVTLIAGDINKATDVRNTLDRLRRFAEDYNCAVVCITHFAKNKAGTPVVERVLGSQAFSAQVRMVWCAVKAEKEDICYLSRIKMNNIKNDHINMKYKIESEVVGDNIQTSKTIWLEPEQGYIGDIFNKFECSEDGIKKITEKEKAKQFLQELLSENDSVHSKKVEELCDEARIHKRSLDRASLELKIIKFKEGDLWYWKLPK